MDGGNLTSTPYRGLFRCLIHLGGKEQQNGFVLIVARSQG